MVKIEDLDKNQKITYKEFKELFFPEEHKKNNDEVIAKNLGKKLAKDSLKRVEDNIKSKN